MPSIDADAHVVESEATWDFMDPSDSQFRPLAMVPKTPRDGQARSGEPWLVDGQIRGFTRQVITDDTIEKLSERFGRNITTTEAARQMENVPARLRHMDELGIDIQVLHSTFFINQIADRPEPEVAICKGWNKWMANIWEQSNDRLRWTTCLPLLAMDEALKLLPWALEHGACGVAMRPIETNRNPFDPYFYPLFEEAQRLDVPIVFHVGNATPSMGRLLAYGRGSSGFMLRLVSAAAVQSLVFAEVPRLFPRLRWGFVETGSMWIPWVVEDLRRRFQDRRDNPFTETILADNRVFVTCQINDDIPYVLKYTGPDVLMIGTDYGHTDTSAEIEALRTLKNNEDIAPEAIDKILWDNPGRLYGISKVPARVV